MRTYLLFAFILCVTVTLNAQVTFSESNYLIQDKKIRSTLSIGIADINGDYKDDLILLDKGTDLITAYQNGPDQPFRMVESGQILGNPAWALSLGDLDNDGISELFACGVSTYGNIFRQNPDGSYSFIQILYGLSFPQNSNMADINNDGWLDLFVCDERAYNDLYLNDQTGKVIYSDYIDMYTVPESDNSGNYGSEWVDFDDDRDIDLFITKCKPGIESPENPLRINVVFENDGSNHYTETGKKWGLKNGAQSWTGSFGDIDNDGDLDCFVSNHDVPHIIYRNIENDTFIDITDELMVPVISAAYESAIRDFDNNGYLDIYVTGDKDYMFWNHGQDIWTIDDEPFGELQVFTFATGDLNDDGFLDVITSHGRLNEPGNYDDVVWINNKNENHYLTLSFLGTESNRQGVGTKIKVYSDLGTQIRDVKIGESYGTTNSNNVHFGMGAVEKIDSIIFYWPSGTIDKYYDIETNRHLLAHESVCLRPFVDIQFTGDHILCQGDSLDLSLNDVFSDYTWSTGDTSSQITVFDESDISFRGMDAEGCIQFSNILHIAYDPDQTPKLEFIAGGQINCPGEEVAIACSPADEYFWSDGSTGEILNPTEIGTYTVTVTGTCRDFISEEIYVEFFEVSSPVFTEDTIVLPVPLPVNLEAEGDSIFWYSDADGLELVGTGNFKTDTIFTDTVFYASNYANHLAESAHVGMENHMGTALGGSNLNSGLKFNCWKPMILEEVKVIAAGAGNRIIELIQINELDGTETLLDSRDVFVDNGPNFIELGFEVDSGLNYVLTTNGDSNMANFGFLSPGFYRSNEGVAFPYSVEGLLEITSSLHGFSYYYYFYDWKVRPVSVSCFSERLPFTILVDTLSGVSTMPVRKESFAIYPNPAMNHLTVESSGELSGISFHLSIHDILGRPMLEKDFTDRADLNISTLPDGMYALIISSSEITERVHYKVIKRE